MSARDNYFKDKTIEQIKDELWFLKCLQYGLEYQDYLTIMLNKVGYNLNNFCSKRYQMTFGENLMKIEIKHDKGIKQFGNVYIEFNAISKDQSELIDGGLTKDDKDIYYLIGDEEQVFIFRKDTLRQLCERVRLDPNHYSPKIRIKQHFENGKPTSSGLIMDLKTAKTYSIRHFNFLTDERFMGAETLYEKQS